MLIYTNKEILSLIKQGVRLDLATQNYPSRGQTAKQELHQTSIGKLFLKWVSQRNHEECQIDVRSGSLAEREFWAFSLAKEIGLLVPQVWLIDESTTVQTWLDYPDGHIYKTSTGIMELKAKNIFECVLFDWITGQVDRHDANYLYDLKNCSVIPVDSAHSFLKYSGSLPDYLHLYEVGHTPGLNDKIHSDVHKKLAGLSKKKLNTIVPLRNTNERLAFTQRTDQIKRITSIDGLIGLYRSK